jgi:molybdopterin converting factor subunit 1
VRFFGPAQEAAGTRHALLELPDGATVRDAVAAVRQAIPGLRGFEGAGLRFAVNAEYAEEDRYVRSGDVIALIPPVGGG